MPATTMARVPNLFIVGAPRCGTTSMYSYLRQHPDVYMPEEKEPRFFCSDLDSGTPMDATFFIRSWDEYLALFRDASDQRYVGEGCIFNLFSEVAAQRIHEASPSAKVIIMLREPAVQMFSFHAVRRGNGTEDLGFAEALAAEAERREGRRLPRLARNLKMYQYRAVASYAGQVARYFDAFGRENVHVIIHEEFARDVPGAFARTLQFLGLPPAAIEFDVENAHRANRSQRLARALHDPVVRQRGRRLIPNFLRPWAGAARQRLTGWNLRPAMRGQLDPALRAQLRRELAPDVERLGQLLGRDLSALWGGAPEERLVAAQSSGT
ncbi:MAG TPA: sulfotransferase [Candidatus Limnocylindria bacterium]